MPGRTLRKCNLFSRALYGASGASADFSTVCRPVGAEVLRVDLGVRTVWRVGGHSVDGVGVVGTLGGLCDTLCTKYVCTSIPTKRLVGKAPI